MSVIARLEVIPTREGNMSEAVASAVGALDRFDVSYETTPTDTVVEADDPDEVFAAAAAAHRAVADERIITSLEVDEQRGRRQDRHDRVASVERELGRPPERERPESPPEVRQQGSPPASRREGVAPASHQQGTAETELRRYHGPVPTGQGESSQSAGARGESRPRDRAETRPDGSRGTATGSRYLQSGRQPSR